MPFPINLFPHSDFHSLDVRYWLEQFEQIRQDWRSLYDQLIEWKGSTIEELNAWKASETARLNAWQETVESNIEQFETELTADQERWYAQKTSELTIWKNNFEDLFDSTFSDLESIKTAAEAARDNAQLFAASAEHYAEEIEGSMNQIAANTSDITDLKEQVKPYIIYAENPSIVGGVSATSGIDVTGATTRRTGYINVSEYNKIAYTRVKLTGASGSIGMAFYETADPSTFISGQTLAYGSDAFGYEIAIIDVPSNANYARFTWNAELNTPLIIYNTMPFDYEELYNNISSVLFANEKHFATSTTGGVSATSGIDVTGATTRRTGYINVSEYNKIAYTRVKLTGASGSIGMAFYETADPSTFISGQTLAYGSDAFGYEIAIIDVPSNANYARFTWNSELNTQFTLYDGEQYVKTLQYQINEINNKFPDYSGKRVSILGDSISTFVLNSEKVDGKAPAGCVTNYPGNVVQYQNSDVTSVDLIWWGQVINHFGMTLGINESWAGSCIAFNPDSTSGGKYTADNCLCSETRINHLGENGNPDIIIVFGGTNDINHHLVGTGPSVRYAVGELNNLDNPFNYDNFPMETATYYGSITTMLLRLQHTYPNATILMLLPYFCTSTHTSSGDRATPFDQNTWANAAIDVCKYLGVEYLDLRTIINLYDVSTLLFDGLHPKANGMKLIANAVIHKLNSML